jgi:hypothetical protein
MNESTRAPRIPDTLPLVVRPTKRGYAIYLGILTGIAFVMIAACVGAPILRYGTASGSYPVASVVVLVLATVLVGLVYWRSFRRWTGRGPRLAASEDGVWLRRHDNAPVAVQLPWSSVTRIRQIRWLGFRALRVFTAAGKPATVSITFTDADLDRLLAELRRLSGGRVQIG